jgi:hypothetical protein
LTSRSKKCGKASNLTLDRIKEKEWDSKKNKWDRKEEIVTKRTSLCEMKTYWI